MLAQRAVKIHSLSEKLKAATGTRLREIPVPVVVGVSGGAFSGKKTFCRELRNVLDSEGIIFLPEAFYRSSPPIARDSEGFPLNIPLVEPNEFDSSMLALHLEGLSSGAPVLVPNYDWERGCRGSTWHVITPAPIIVVEGEFLFEDPAVFNRLDFKIFVDTPLESRVERLIAMEGAQKNLPKGWGEKEVRERLLFMNELYVEPRRRLADAFVSGEGPFDASLYELGARILDEVFSRCR